MDETGKHDTELMTLFLICTEKIFHDIEGYTLIFERKIAFFHIGVGEKRLLMNIMDPSTLHYDASKRPTLLLLCCCFFEYGKKKNIYDNFKYYLNN